MKKYKEIRSKLSIFVSFFLSFLITLIFLSVALLLGGLNNNVINNDLKKMNYYQSGYEDFIQQAKAIASSFGLSENVISENITLANYHIKSNNYLTYASKNADTKAIDIAIDMELDNVVRLWNEEIKEKHGNVTLEESQNIDLCATEIATLYKDSIDFPFIKDIAVHKEKYISFLKIALPIELLCVAVIAITLFVTTKYKHRALRYILYAVIGSDIVTLVFGVYLLKLKDQLIHSDNVRYQAFLELYYRDSVVPFFLIFSAGILLAVFLMLMIRQMRNQLIAKNNNN